MLITRQILRDTANSYCLQNLERGESELVDGQAPSIGAYKASMETLLQAYESALALVPDHRLSELRRHVAATRVTLDSLPDRTPLDQPEITEQAYAKMDAHQHQLIGGLIWLLDALPY